MQPIGRETARVPAKAADHSAFGLWADRADLADVAAYVRKLRKGRFNDL